MSYRTNPASRAVAIVVNTPFPTCRSIYVGVSGNLTATMEDGVNCAFTNVPVGVFPIVCSNITTATASGLVALY